MTQLNPQQLQALRTVYSIGVGRGLSHQQAVEMAAAAFAESGLNPNATNRSSGAAGLFQLLSPGYRQKAQQLGGLYNSVANTKAILPSYAAFFASHPNAQPGLAGAQVERSGQGPGFYARPLSLVASALGSVGGPGVSAGVPPAQASSGRTATSAPSAAAAPLLALFSQQLMRSIGSRSGNILPALQTAGQLRQLSSLGMPATTPAATPPVAPDTTRATQSAKRASMPLVEKAVRIPTKVIGTPYSGSHTLGNWESDNAYDLALPYGTPVYAVSSGTIGSKYGYLDHQGPESQGRFAGKRLHLVSRGNEFYYAHLSDIVVRPGQRVKAGQLLGFSGQASGVPHLHIAERR